MRKSNAPNRGSADRSILRICLSACQNLERKPAFPARAQLVSRLSPRIASISEGILSLKFTRTGEGPAASVVRLTPGPLPDDPFSESARLAKADRELNAIYAALLKRLNPSKQNALRSEQRGWLEQRDRQADEAVRNKSDSENARIVRDRVLRQLTEERSAELRKREAEKK
jgi:hypothetical protein